MRSKFSTLFISAFLLGLVVLPSPGRAEAQTLGDPEAVVQAFIQSLNTADIATLLDLFDPDATVFGPFAGSPARLEGRDEIRELFEPLFSQVRQSAEGPQYMNLKPRDVQVQQLGAVAVVSFHLGSLPDQPLERPYSFSRRTLVLQQSAERWIIVHLHASNVLIPASKTD